MMLKPCPRSRESAPGEILADLHHQKRVVIREERDVGLRGGADLVFAWAFQPRPYLAGVRSGSNEISERVAVHRAECLLRRPNGNARERLLNSWHNLCEMLRRVIPKRDDDEISAFFALSHATGS